MAQSTGNAQLKEHVALIDALRHKYADGEDAQSVAAIEALLSEASRTSESVDETARDIIQSRCSVGETLLSTFLSILLCSAQRVGWTELVSQNAKTLKKSEYPETEDAHQQRLLKLKEAKAAVQDSLDTATQETR